MGSSQISRIQVNGLNWFCWSKNQLTMILNKHVQVQVCSSSFQVSSFQVSRKKKKRKKNSEKQIKKETHSHLSQEIFQTKPNVFKPKNIKNISNQTKRKISPEILQIPSPENHKST